MLHCSYVVCVGIIVVMYVAKVPNEESPAVLLRESYREAGKVKNRTLANLSSWPEAKVNALTRVLKGQLAPAAAAEGTFEIARSLPHGHVAAVLGTARALGLEELIDPVPSRQRDLVTAMTVAQVIAPDSKLAIARGLREETAASSLGQVLGAGGCDEDDLYAAMDWLATPARPHPGRARGAAPGRRHPGPLRRVLRRVRGADLPAGCHRPPQGRGAGRLQMVYGLLTSTSGVPVAIEVFAGNTGDPTTVASQVAKVRDRFGLTRVVLAGDRGMLTAARLREDVGPGGAGLDHRAARPPGQGAGPRRRAAAVPLRLRPDGPGRDHLPGLPRRAAGGVQEPVPGSRAGPQARKPPPGHRG